MVAHRVIFGRPLLQFATVAALLTLCVLEPVSAFDIPCKAEPDTTVVVTEVVAKGASRIEVRRKLVETAVEEGIRTVIGVQIQSRSAAQVSSEDGEINEKFLERMRAQSAGYGRPDVLDEAVTSSGGETLLELKVRVTVCVPKNPLLVKRVVAIGSTLNSSGEELEEFRNIIASELSSSPAFALAPRAEQDFADIRVSGKILDYGVTRRTIKGKRYNRITVNFALEGELEADGSVITHAVQEFKNVLAEIDIDEAMDDFMVGVLTSGTRQFHDKLLATAPNAKKIDQSVKKSDQGQSGEFGLVGGKPTIAVYPPVGPGTKGIEKLGFDKQEITRRLEEALRATGRFALFERSRELLAASVEAEQDLSESGSYLADAAERGKLANVKLIVQPFVAEFVLQSQFEEVDGLPGMYERIDHGKVTLTCKVLDTTSGEIKHQVTISWGFERESDDVFEGKVGGPGQSEWIEMADEIGTRSATAMVNTVFPVMVIKFSRGRVFLNRGKGGGIKKGDILELFSVGEELKDPQTGETLGGEEFSIGKIKVIKVAAKFSTAKPLDGLEDDPQPGDIAR